jgi:GNAT superfamily N-acetyltransferase
MITKYINITKENRHLHFEYLQNERFFSRFKKLTNQSAKELQFFDWHYYDTDDHCLTLAILPDYTIVGAMLSGLYGTEERAISFISVHEKYRNRGIAKALFFENSKPFGLPKIGSSFTKDGFNYLRPFLIKQGVKVNDHIG